MTEAEVIPQDLPLIEALSIVDEALYQLRATTLIESPKMVDYLLDIRLLLKEASGRD